MARASIHPNFAAGAAGSRFSSDGKHHVTFVISDDEVNDADPYIFHLAVGSCLRTQERVLKAILEICPDVEAPELRAELSEVSMRVEEVWWTLTRRYAERV